MKFVKEFVVPALVLTIICIAVSGALVLTYNTTEPIIEAAKRAEADAARVVVLPDGKDFKEIKDLGIEGLTEAYKAENGAGYVFMSKAKGYGGDLFVMTGIKADGTIAAVKMMTNSETQGIGSQTAEAPYTDQYKGKDFKLDGVEAISGATVSSSAFGNAVKVAFEAYGKIAGVDTSVAAVPPEKQIFPEVETFEEMTVAGAKKAMKAGDAGFILVIEGSGYSSAPGPMEIYVGFGADGKIAGVAAGENKETQGIGSKALEAAHLDQYKGKDNADGVEAISGSTETSDGVKAAVKKAVELAATVKGGAAAPAAGGAEAAVPAGPAAGDAGTEVKAAGVDKAMKYADGSMVITASAQGYRPTGVVSVTVTISADGKIANLAVNADIETVGVGTLAEEATYTDSWKGKGAGEAPAAITGATATSNAVKTAVQKAFTAFNASKGA